MNFSKQLLTLFILVHSVYAGFTIGTLSRSRSSDNSLELYGKLCRRGSTLTLNDRSRSSGSFREKLCTNDTISFPLFNDLTVKTVVDTHYTLLDGSLYWRGTNISGEDGYSEFVLVDNTLSGNIYSSDIVYKLSGSDAGVVTIYELDLSRSPDAENCSVENSSDADVLTVSHTREKRSLTPTVVDILVLYSPALRASVGEATLNADVVRYVNQLNTIFENSKMNTRVHLVHHAAVSDISDDIQAASEVRASAEAVALREQYGADIVSFWSKDGITGSAFRYTSSSTSEEHGFNTSRYQFIVSNYTFAHETAHNLGADHDRHSSLSGYDSNKYQFGYLFEYDQWLTGRTVMAYNNCTAVGITGGLCTRLPYFSNPTITYGTATIGVYAPSPEAAFNALYIDEHSPMVANYETRVNTGGQTYQLTVKNGSGTGAYEPNTAVTITAIDSTPWGRDFDHWGADNGTFSSATRSPAILFMPEGDVVAEAFYRDTMSLFKLVVTGGGGDGEYPVGKIVTVTATPEVGKEFSHWQGDDEIITDVTAETTTVTIPAENCTIEAVYNDILVDSSNLSWNLIADAQWSSQKSGSDCVVSLDASKVDSDTVSASLLLIGPDGVGSAKITGEMEETFDNVTTIKVTYQSNEDVNIILEQNGLSIMGLSYLYTISATGNTAKTVYLPIAAFVQPDWVGPMTSELDLSEVKAVSFEPAKSGEMTDVTISNIQMTNYPSYAVSMKEHTEVENSFGAVVSLDGVTLTTPHTGMYSVAIFSINGRIIYQDNMLAQAGTTHFPLTKLPRGVFILSVRGAGNLITRKVVVQ